MDHDTPPQETDTKSQQQVVWHASRSDIERPTIAGRVEGDHHANSGLGIFCATVPREYVALFGSWMHEITLVDEPRRLRMCISELSRLGHMRDREWFHAHASKLAHDFDMIDLVEVDGRIEQVILLRDEAIASSRCISSEEFKSIMITGPVTPRAPKPS